MKEEPIPPTVARFVVASIPTVASLEALLHLRAHAGRELPAAEIAAALFVEERLATRVLDRLVAHGLLRGPPDAGGYAFAPATPELATAVDELSEVYRTRLVPLHHFIHARAEQAGAESFANAFRLRKG